MNIFKSIVLSLLVFLFLGPIVGTIVVLVKAGDFHLIIFVWGYIIGMVPAVVTCVINFILFLILPDKIKSFSYAVGFLSGIISSSLLIAVLLLDNNERGDFTDKVLLILALIAIPTTICGGIVNSYLNRWLNSEYQA
ncbi:hypothetical protein [Alkalimarinus coralli]|uniref:hypothetical protein n=1 Tax=Alkalimarinus coralli TaxID=2935863 RepID=UPI00202B0445|nr:hypothetical protein [Alkalimarinus coralli]